MTQNEQHIDKGQFDGGGMGEGFLQALYLI